MRDRGTLTLINSTIANNKLLISLSEIEFPGAGVSNGGSSYYGSTVNVRNSIIAGNTVANSSINTDFHRSLTSQGYNLIGSDYGAQITGVTTGNIVGANPRLGPLAYNGGPTKTHALLTGSPAINAGSDALAVAGGFTSTERR